MYAIHMLPWPLVTLVSWYPVCCHLFPGTRWVPVSAIMRPLIKTHPECSPGKRIESCANNCSSCCWRLCCRSWQRVLAAATLHPVHPVAARRPAQVRPAVRRAAPGRRHHRPPQRAKPAPHHSLQNQPVHRRVRRQALARVAPPKLKLQMRKKRPTRVLLVVQTLERRMRQPSTKP